MKRIAITGGIGSGKSYVCQALARRGIKVYDCDAEAKRLMAENADLRQQLAQLVGDDVYINKVLQKPVLANFLLVSEENKQAVNEIVHPFVAADFMASDFQWLESAILFDSGFDKRVSFDFIVGVVAPLEVRIQRVMLRDGISREKTLDWVNRQLPQDVVARKCHFLITNDGKADIDKQINELLNIKL